MAVITISRELAALGDETAKALSMLLNYRLVDKSVLDERIKSYGIPSSKIEKFDEKKPSFLATLSKDRDDYLHFLKSAILDEAGQKNAVFVGRGAGFILKSAPAVFSVFLVAPWDVRLERVKSYFRCDDKRARQVIEKNDHDREGFHRYFFEKKWKDPANYHLVVNTGNLHPEFCAETIKFVLDKTITEEAEAENVKRIAELSLEHQIKNHLLYQKELAIHFLEVQVSGDRISLYGVANSRSLAELAVSSAKELAGDYLIQSDIQVVNDYSVMP